MSDEEPSPGDEPTWIELEGSDPDGAHVTAGSRVGWVVAAVGVVAVLALVAAIVLWPDDGDDEKEVSLGQGGGTSASLVALTLGGELLQIDPATGDERVLADLELDRDVARQSVISLAPDGSTLYLGPRSDVEVEDPTILAYDLESSAEPEVVAYGSLPSLSSDGRALAFVPPIVQPGQRPTVTVVALDDGSTSEIFVEEGTPNQPVTVDALAWTPDSSAIYISYAGDQVHGGRLSPVTGDRQPGGWGAPGPADPRPAAFLDDQTLASVDPSGADPGRVVAFAPAISDTLLSDDASLPTTAPPSTAPLATVTPAPSDAPGNGEEPRGLDEQRELFTVDGTVTGLAASPDGTALAATVATIDDQPRTSLVHWTEEDGLVEVAYDVTAVAWGPPLAPEPEPEPESTTTTGPPVDEALVAAITTEGDLVLLSPETGDVERVVVPELVPEQSEYDCTLRFDLASSPDGSTIYVGDFYGDVPGTEGSGTTVVDVESGQTERLAGRWSPSVSPDGSTVAFVTDAAGSIELLDRDSDEVRTSELPTLLPDGDRVFEVEWSTDGELLIVRRGALYFRLTVVDADPPPALRQTIESPTSSEIPWTGGLDSEVLLFLQLVDGRRPLVHTNVPPAAGEDPGDLLLGLDDGAPLNGVAPDEDQPMSVAVNPQDRQVVGVVCNEDADRWQLVSWSHGSAAQSLDAGGSPAQSLREGIVAAAWLGGSAPASGDTSVTSTTTVPSTTLVPSTTVPGAAPSTTVPASEDDVPPPPEPPPATATRTGP